MSSVYYCETNIIEDNLFPACWQLLESDHKKECLTANLFILWGLKCLVTIRQIEFYNYGVGATFYFGFCKCL